MVFPIFENDSLSEKPVQNPLGKNILYGDFDGRVKEVINKEKKSSHFFPPNCQNFEKNNKVVAQ